ncbi:MAG: hypothetical protein JOZ66_00350, partial [Hyphomicrobiales bacterium]|nr:hypothetical protein [Hyphomicrobiales bacterium]
MKPLSAAKPSAGKSIAYPRRAPLAAFALIYTIVSGGPFLWVAMMSLRTTPEIFASPYA